MGKLTVRKIASLSEPKRHADGNGLYLNVTKTGNKSWLYRTKVAGKTSWRGLGSTADVTLAQARDLATDMRRTVKQTSQPPAVKDRPEKIPTFKAFAKTFIQRKSAGFKSQKQTDAWNGTMRDHVYDFIGNHPVTDIKRADVVDILNKMVDAGKLETADRVRNRIEQIMDAAFEIYEIDIVNPAAKKRIKMEFEPIWKKRRREAKHFSSVPFVYMPAFMTHLAKRKSRSARAVELIINTTCRQNEMLASTWGEYDLKTCLWIIPPERMKNGKEHRVPLSTQAIKILKSIKDQAACKGDADFIFPGVGKGGHLTEAATLRLVQHHMNYEATVHGFRSSFSTWAAEKTMFAGQLIESQLAHSVGSAVERAYQRGDYMDRRRELVQAWADYVYYGEAKGDNIVPLKRIM